MIECLVEHKLHSSLIWKGIRGRGMETACDFYVQGSLSSGLLRGKGRWDTLLWISLLTELLSKGEVGTFAGMKEQPGQEDWEVPVLLFWVQP